MSSIQCEDSLEQDTSGIDGYLWKLWLLQVPSYVCCSFSYTPHDSVLPTSLSPSRVIAFNLELGWYCTHTKDSVRRFQLHQSDHSLWSSMHLNFFCRTFSGCSTHMSTCSTVFDLFLPFFQSRFFGHVRTIVRNAYVPFFSIWGKSSHNWPRSISLNFCLWYSLTFERKRLW